MKSTTRLVVLAVAVFLTTGRAMAGDAEFGTRLSEVRTAHSDRGGGASRSASLFVEATNKTGAGQNDGWAHRTQDTGLAQRTGDTTTSFTPSAFNETATRIIDTDGAPVRAVMIWANPTNATQFGESIVGFGMVGFSIYGKTAANLRQGFMPVRPGDPLVLKDLYWSQTAGDSVSVFVESSASASALTYHMQVIR